MTTASTSTPSNQDFLQLLGSDVKLWSPSTKTYAKPSEILANKVVCLYFSAIWCGPCTRFTPALKSLYSKLKGKKKASTLSEGGDDDNVEDFELVFCSLDKTEDGYRNYTETMPWWCLPFKSPLTGKLTNMYVQGGQLSIPLLVILDTDGSVIVPDGVGEVSLDPDGQQFPWRPKPVSELLPKYYIDHEKNGHPMSDLDDKYLMLYFSAHWCPPCRGFTPKLSKAYTQLKQQKRSDKKDDFELLFVSSDRNQAAFDEYFAEMTFGAIPFEERQAKTELSKRLQVRGIPTLMMFGPGPERRLINADCRGVMEHGDYLSEFPYAPKPYGDLNLAADNINKYKCIIVFHEAGDDEEQEDIQEALKLASEQCQDKSVRFLWVTSPEGLAKMVRQVTGLGPIRDEPAMILLDIPDHGSYYVRTADDPSEVTHDSILAFLENPGEKRQIEG